MIRIKQFLDQLSDLVAKHARAKKDISDPLYIAWMVDHVFDNKAPPVDKQTEFKDIMIARKSTSFREFWNTYKGANEAVNGFQMCAMGIIPNVTRQMYQKQFIKEHPGEVPF